MSNSPRKKLNKYAKYFLEPTNATHRQYEALRAVYVDGVAPAEAAKQFGYSTGSFHVLSHQFREDPDREYFLPTTRGPQTAPKRNSVKESVVELRKQNMSIYEISKAQSALGTPISPAHVANILKEEGFARLPRRADEERFKPPGPEGADAADCRKLNLSPRKVHTSLGGLFLFLPMLAKLNMEQILADCKFPGTDAVPAAHAMRSLLALKLFGSARHGHVMSRVFDGGLAMLAGLNVVPKRAFLTQYSCRITPATYPQFMRRWFDALAKIGGSSGTSFDLDFHSIPFHGEAQQKPERRTFILGS